MKKQFLLAALTLAIPFIATADVIFRSKKDLTVSVNKQEAEVVGTALEIFSKDYKAVFDAGILKGDNGQIIIGTLGNSSVAEKMIAAQSINELKTHKEGYVIEVKDDKLYILGSDKRGTAYGILEISRRIGVSPWEWWADSGIEKKNTVELKNGFHLLEYPSVAHRGIFLNDEDWGINPWSYLTHEPSAKKGQIGPKTHERIFELLLRLRANMFWPAMHECSVAFYLTPGNREAAAKYGIIVGGSHCEPMMRNSNAEWKIDGIGEYDYVHNRENVLKFWETRVKELKTADNIYTIGIRGVHDGKMQGANTVQEQFNALTGVIKDQRKMIATFLNPKVDQVPQVFIPYKEVLDVYNMGLDVPEDVTLLWCDDNYGYIRHFPSAKEQKRKGGNGVYYHVSYWGRPHDYLWLATNHPAQVYTQMKMAYDKGAKDMWVLNVGDIKPGEYLTELFLDMAWNIKGVEDNNNGLDNHLKNWLTREFGPRNAGDLLEVMNEYYRLAYIRKPEFMGNTRTEEKDPKYKVVSDLPWSEEGIKQRISDYQNIADKVIKLSATILPEKKDAWFELIEYPVRAAAEMNKKHLYAQLARHELSPWQNSDLAYDSIVSLTQKYNALANGKWNKMMDAQPRKLSVFDRVERTKAEKPLPEYVAPISIINGKDFTKFNGEKPNAYGLGYGRGAIALKKDNSTEYHFNHTGSDSVNIEVALAPNHPVDGKQIRFEISIDGSSPKILNFQTQDRNEEWKRNVLSNQAIRSGVYKLQKKTTHTITIKALDEGVVVDQIRILKR